MERILYVLLALVLLALATLVVANGSFGVVERRGAGAEGFEEKKKKKKKKSKKGSEEGIVAWMFKKPGE